MSDSFCVKIKSKNGQLIMKDLHNAMTLRELKGRLAELTKIQESHLHILNGFPPRPLDIAIDNERTIAAAGIRSGEILIVEEKQNGYIAATAAPSAAVVVPVAVTLPPQQSMSQLEEDEALARRLQAEEDEEQMRQLAGEQRVAQPAAAVEVPAAPEEVNYNGILLKKVVPADNSCLFTSIRFVLNGKIDNEGSEMMRHIIAQEVAADPQSYNDAVLGKSNAEYCSWIQKPDSWGGAIEVAILSNYYGIEIDVVDIQNAIINRFGEDKNYGLRVFLLFDGIHYDPLYLETASGGVPATIFPIEEMGVYQQAEQLANEAKSARQFTNVDKFTLRCIQCDVMLVGQTQAQEHAKTTGHTNFSEI